MSRSINATANFVFKLHVAALQSATDTTRLYPVMDGFYVSCPARNEMLDFLRAVFKAVADEFNRTVEPHHRFCIRGAVACGPVIHGEACGECAVELKNKEPYREKILLGMPMVQAHLSERGAPPFGVFVHESARVFAPANTDPLHWVWWKWGIENDTVWERLKTKLCKHLEWCEKRSGPLEYPLERIKAHKEMVRQYFER